MERVTDEEAGEGGWFWNEQVGSYRPPGALYCRECGVLIQDYDHLYVLEVYRSDRVPSSSVLESHRLTQSVLNIARSGVHGPGPELVGTTCLPSRCLLSRLMFFATLRLA